MKKPTRILTMKITSNEVRWNMLMEALSSAPSNMNKGTLDLSNEELYIIRCLEQLNGEYRELKKELQNAS